MNMDRLAKIIVTDYTSELLKLEERLEKTINNDFDVDTKTMAVKNILERMVLTEQALGKFQSLLTNNNVQQNQTENGQV